MAKIRIKVVMTRPDGSWRAVHVNGRWIGADAARALFQRLAREGGLGPGGIPPGALVYVELDKPEDGREVLQEELQYTVHWPRRRVVDKEEP